MNKISVFYACDDNYIPCLSVSLISLISNSSKNNFYDITVLNSGISSENINVIKAFEQENVKISFKNVSSALKDIADKLCLRDYYSLCIYYRIFIPELFPEKEKAVYLDADTVLLEDVALLFNTPLEGNLVAAAPDMVVASEEIFRRYCDLGVGIPYKEYFNSGVLVMDLAQMRKKRLQEHFIFLLNKYNFQTICPDQDYLNVICRKSVKRIDTSWNKMSVDASHCEELKLIHYNMYFKPWLYKEVLYGEFFWQYARLSPFYEVLKDMQESFGQNGYENDAAAGEMLRAQAEEIIQSSCNFKAMLKEEDLKKQDLLPPDRIEVVKKIKEYEALGGDYFFCDVENDPPSRTLMPEDVDYLHKTLRFKINGILARNVENVCMYVCKHKYDITVSGAENLKDISGGAIFTSNHFSVTENLAVKLAGKKAPKKRRMYKLVREGNFFMPGTIGWLLKYCDTLPLSKNLGTLKLLDKAISQILAEGNFILIYPEQAMWWHYPKPRPYKIGAYHYAAKNNVPIVPCFVTMHKKDENLPILPNNVKYAMHILKPIYPDKTKNVRQEAYRMMNENAELCRKTYEKYYPGGASFY